ncbi:leucyl aminopeptidase family protein [Candidatus Odyssella acanthamoebae]|uniref:leucyl aminopeptidase family protein n=1 Tax=Candidatus Odyssella acanthamoebae TaxID=91604 RepID=UPI000691580B|nr:leucyl aminopeptidase family protein [Candidatus Paracaedibacter acanthamoebae]
MLNTCFTESASTVTPIRLCNPSTLSDLLKHRPLYVQTWVEQHEFKAMPSSILLVPNGEGQIDEIFWGLDETPWQFASLAGKLPSGTYQIDDWGDLDQSLACLTWALASYQFTRYKEQKNKKQVILVWPSAVNRNWVETAKDAITLVRDLINTPACDLTPVTLADAVKTATANFGAQLKIILGDELQHEFPAIHTVGKAAEIAPRLIDLRWSHPQAKKSIAIVGKGVCFDSGGLDIKPSAGMFMMKKDMGGAAHALALAMMIMKLNLPISLHLLIPAVENAVSGNAMHPMDIIKTRKGLTVEIGNTDAEGRLILCDALYEACQSKPDLVIDFATLTGAARIALGTELPAVFSNNQEISDALLAAGCEMQEPLWPMPLHKPYVKLLKSPIADLSSTGKSSYGGAIVAALFLEQFVEKDINWIHIDHMAWNLSSTPGKPEGGEAMGLLPAFKFISNLLEQA